MNEKPEHFRSFRYFSFVSCFSSSHNGSYKLLYRLLFPLALASSSVAARHTRTVLSLLDEINNRPSGEKCQG
jgi:hypothetical protein